MLVLFFRWRLSYSSQFQVICAKKKRFCLIYKLWQDEVIGRKAGMLVFENSACRVFKCGEQCVDQIEIGQHNWKTQRMTNILLAYLIVC